MNVRLCVLLAFLFTATMARSAVLVVSVRNTDGAPVANAVVTVYPKTAKSPLTQINFDWPMRMVQQHLTFSPFVLVAPVGATVSFPNFDRVRHHVYSFSAAHPFELKLYGKDEARTVRFDKPGKVALGCNIHDQMVAFIDVVDTPYAAKTGEDGEATIRDLPEEAVTLHVWHPYMKSPKNEQVRTLILDASRNQQKIVSDIRVPHIMAMKY